MTADRFRPTLRQVFAVTVLGLALFLAILFYLQFDGSRRAIVESSGQLRSQDADRISEKIATYLDTASNGVDRFSQQFSRSILSIKDLDGIERAFYAELLSTPDLQELTLTYGVKTGRTPKGNIDLSPEGRGQLSVFRSSGDANAAIMTRRVELKQGSYIAFSRVHNPDKPFPSSEFVRDPHPVGDPTQHDTFETAASADFYGQKIWTDMHRSELDAAKSSSVPDRMAVTVQRTIEDAGREFVGVLRAGLLADNLDRYMKAPLLGPEDDFHQKFICDSDGRLITRIKESDPFVLIDDTDWRVQPRSLPPEIAAALKQTALSTVDHKNPRVTAEPFSVNGRTYLATFNAFSGTQQWILGIVAPEDAYLGDLYASRYRLLIVSVVIMVLILVGGILTVRLVRRDLTGVQFETNRMRQFDFSPSNTEPRLQDVADVAQGLERSKTAIRAMSRYVPLELVRELYSRGEDPKLGGQLRELSLMFTDIRDFTTLAEKLAPNDLARALGLYLEAMTASVHATGGAVDKFIGDAVMAMWNAPKPLDNHARAACTTALGCRRRIETLHESPQWGDLPHFDTRIGLHTDEVMVGHFGAPERMNYTAMGDGVNTASRLEGLNKQYGTVIIASQAIVDRVKDHFEFRVLDLVAVKGKAKGLRIYELLGEKGGGTFDRQLIDTYEKAFNLYLDQKFIEAAALLATQPNDPPSKVMCDRCQDLSQHKPANWTGVYISKTK